MKTQNPENQIMELLGQISIDTQLILVQNFGVLFFGNSGSGKSTLINYLVSNQNLKIQQKYFRFQYITNQSKPNSFSAIKIGKKIKAQTSIPITVKYKEYTFRDLPGFLDDRENQDLKNSFYFQDIFNKTKQKKIILVAKYQSIDNKSQFFYMIDSFLKLFDKRLHLEISNSSILIITKVPSEIQCEDVYEQIKQKNQEYKNQENQNKMYNQNKIYNYNFINSLIINNRIGIFYKPTDLVINFHPNQSIYKLIQKISWLKSENKDEKINISVSQRTQNTLSKSSKRYSQLIQQNWDNITSQIQKFLNNCSYNTITQNLNFMIEIRSFIFSIKNQKSINYFLLKCLGFFKDQAIIIDKIISFQKMINFLDLMDSITDAKSYKLQKLKSLTIKSMKLNDKYKSCVSQIGSKHKQTAYFIYQKIIQSKQIKQIAQYILKNNFKVCVIFAEKIKLTEDIRAQGVTFLIHSQSIQTPNQGKIIFDLSGKAGKQLNSRSIDKHGLPGKCGENSGSIYLTVNQIFGKGLQFNLSGGNGGKGQDCQISDLQKYIPDIIAKMTNDPNTQQKIFLKKRIKQTYDDMNKTDIVIDTVKMIVTFNGRMIQTYRTDIINLWEKYYKLMPGCGGQKGRRGIFNVDKKFKAIIMQKAYSFPGENGKLWVDIYEGIYIRQLQACAARKQGKIVDLETGGDVAVKASTLGSLSVAVGVNIGKQAAKIVAQQAAKQVVVKTATSAIVGGVLTLGAGLIVQSILSPISAWAFTKFKVEPKIIIKKGKFKDVPSFNKPTISRKYLFQIQKNILSFLKQCKRKFAQYEIQSDDMQSNA